MQNIIIRKYDYSNILKILQSQKENFQKKKNDIFYISAQNIDSGYTLELPRRGGSNEYPQSMFYSKIRKIMYTPVNPSFTIFKWGLRGSKLYRRVFVMWNSDVQDYPKSLSWFSLSYCINDPPHPHPLGRRNCGWGRVCGCGLVKASSLQLLARL